MMPLRASRKGQVLVEVSLAAVGAVVLAFMISRVGIWLNESMVDRNTAYQASRPAAATSTSLVRFGTPDRIHLIGPSAGAAGGSGQGAGPSAARKACSGAAQAATDRAMDRRREAQQCMQDGEAARARALDLSNQAAALVGVANVLEDYRQRIEACLAALAALNQQFTDCQARAAQCTTDQTACETNNTNCLRDCDSALMVCTAACPPDGLSRAICVGLCNTADATCRTDGPLSCETLYGGTPACQATCENCDGYRNWVEAKFTECATLITDRNSYCNGAMSQYGVLLNCENPRSALTAANTKTKAANDEIQIAKTNAGCVFDKITAAEEAERDAYRLCAQTPDD